MKWMKVSILRPPQNCNSAGVGQPPNLYCPPLETWIWADVKTPAIRLS